MKELASILTMYAVTPCHAGSGSSVGIVDLPIQRERHTNWPVIASSGVKGAMRAHFDRFSNKFEYEEQKEKFNDFVTKVVFGTDDTNNSKKSGYAGSVSVSDAKIIAFPMRSDIAPFVWITCPAVLKRLVKDLKLAKKIINNDLDTQLKEIDNKLKSTGTAPANESDIPALCWIGEIPEEQVLLEEMVVSVKKEDPIKELSPYFKGVERLLIVNDSIFDYGVTHCTQITAQIQIDQATGTTKNGSLRYQEELPSDTLMYAVIFWDNSFDPEKSLKMETIRDNITKNIMREFLQVGGDETCGRGIFQLEWDPKEN